MTRECTSNRANDQSPDRRPDDRYANCHHDFGESLGQLESKYLVETQIAVPLHDGDVGESTDEGYGGHHPEDRYCLRLTEEARNQGCTEEDEGSNGNAADGLDRPRRIYGIVHDLGPLHESLPKACLAEDFQEPECDQGDPHQSEVGRGEETTKNDDANDLRRPHGGAHEECPCPRNGDSRSEACSWSTEP